MLKKYYPIVFPLIFNIASTPITALASGVQVSPTRLDFEGAAGAKQLTVANPSGDVVVFEVYAEDYPDSITVSPNNFTLEPGGRKTVSVGINPRGLPNGLKTNLDVLGKPLSQNSLAVAAGIKIPLAVLARPAKAAGKGQAIIIFLCLAALAALLALRHKKSAPPTSPPAI